MERTLAGLGNRVFLLHNVHEDGASIFESRWAMSYLRGPMTRDQIKTVMDARRAPAVRARPSVAPASARISTAGAGTLIGATSRTSTPSTPIPAAEPEAPTAPAVESARSGGLESSRPTLPPAIPQHFIPRRGPACSIVYQPMLLGAASVRFADTKTRIDVTQAVVLLTPINDDAVPVDWAEAQDVELDPNDLERNPAGAAQFAALPPAAAQAKNYANWQKDFVNAIYGSRKVTLLKSTTYNQVSRIDEGEGDFRVRLSQASREQRDAATAKLRAKYAPKIANLNERLRRAEQAVERETAQARQATFSSVVSIGSTLLGAFLGKRAISVTNLNKAGTAVRSLGRAAEQSGDVARAGETTEAIKQQLADLDAQFQAEAKAVEGGLDPASESFETIELRPNKTNISVKLVSLAWTPHVRDASGQLTPLL